ncbi:DNA-binding MarR family transcriptional regulator [Saccharothrix tamanrassetensis]|uniref:DNA-binding MarR family transcriptional regulator n=1 Tax=Saccharothrix tamanrassetensis TaxID=1051531 RepID=A0A841CE09_9PSEU|nr:MarR family transcriptional regulator [Saccharothrix tamanrassetensis]MBB5955203.1 DNA-binding MarR family transcriptional regulator [Saccharothrix tamanrassetensis]
MSDLGRELSTAVVAYHEAVGAHLGVTAVDQRALALIGRHGPLSAGDLAKRIGLTPGAVTGVIDRLERAGLARRDPDPEDRRRVVVTAIGDGFGRVFAGLSAAMGELTSRYSPEQQEVIADWVTRAIDVLREQTRRLTEGSESPGTR